MLKYILALDIKINLIMLIIIDFKACCFVFTFTIRGNNYTRTFNLRSTYLGKITPLNYKNNDD